MTELASRSIEDVEVERVRGSVRERRRDALVVEEPLEIRIRHGGPEGASESSLGLTMRTPGHDEDLVAGLLVSEGVVKKPKELKGFGHGLDRDGHPDPNVVVAELGAGVPYDPRDAERLMVRSSACGICGRASLDTLRARAPPPMERDRPRMADAALRALPDRLRQAQPAFAVTGGLHAAALFDSQGRIEVLREDVGRHNAVDKVVGAQFRAGRLPLGDRGLVVSGRAGFEILQKALMAGIPLVAAIGAPSSLSVQLATEFGITLVGFLRLDGYNVYTEGGRIETSKSHASIV